MRVINEKELLAECLRRFTYDKESGKLYVKTCYARGVKIGEEPGTLDRGHRIIGINYKAYQAHRLIWLMTYGQMPPRKVVHINGYLEDNRISNLRLASDGKRRNRRKKVRTVPQKPTPIKEKSAVKEYIGVLRRNGKWIAHINLHGQERQIGVFSTALEAAKAYDRKAIELYGVYATTNGATTK